MRNYNLLLFTVLVALQLYVVNAGFARPHKHNTRYLGPDCSSYANGIVLPDPTSCSQYYICRNGRAISRHCGLGLYFDSEAFMCNFAALVDCSLDEHEVHQESEDLKKISAISSVATCEPPTTTCVPPTTTCSTTIATTTCSTSTTTCSTATTTTTCSTSTTTCSTSTTTTTCSTSTTTSSTSTTTTTCSTSTTTTTCSTSTTTCSTSTTTTTCSTSTTTTTCSTSTTTTTCSTSTTTTTCSTAAATTPCSTSTATTTCAYTTSPCTTANGPEEIEKLNIFSAPSDCAALDDGTYLLDARHCRRYYICRRGRARRLKCSAGHWFDYKLKACRNSIEVTNCPAQRS